MCGKQEMAELCTHRDTRFPAPCPLNTGVFTFNSKQQQQPAAFPTAPSITRQSLTRIFQWLLCQHRNKEPSPAICCPCYGWLSAHSDKAWLCTTSSHSASVPSPTGRRFGRWEGQGEQGCQGWTASSQWSAALSTTAFTSQGVRLQPDSHAWGKGDPGYVVSRLRLERWSALSLLQIETMM